MTSRFLLPLAALLLAAGCATAPKGPEAPGPEAFGKYYKDDGPPETSPDLDQVAEAVPRDEPFHKYANRPYTVFGKTYVPVVNKEPTKERGIASWYGRRFHGQKTASGEPYDMFAMTAAHKTLPIPSYARVTNVKNGKSVVVRINDRGPFHANRIIDLSYAAAKRIGIAGQGSGLVDVQRIVAPEEGQAPSAATTEPQPTATVETQVVAREDSSIWLQLGAFSSAEAAEAFRVHVERELSWVNEPIQVSWKDGLHRVRLGPYRSNTEANAIAHKVRRSLGVAPILTSR